MSSEVIRFTKKEARAIQGLMEKVHIRTPLDFIMNAVVFARWAKQETAAGRFVASVDLEANNYREVVGLPFLRPYRKEKRKKRR